jgi:rare lipoprotein A
LPRLSTPLVRLAALLVLAAPVLAACSGMGGVGPTVQRAAFTSKEFGVKASPRVTTNPNPPKGGGRYLVGKPYVVAGRTYVPNEQPEGYAASGSASWYGADFHGRRTANGEIFSANAITGAHPTLPLPSYVRVTNRDNGRSVVVRVNDRGPYLHGRVMDLSHRAAEILGYVDRGVGTVDIRYVGPAPLEGDDTRMLLASVTTSAGTERGDIRLAMAEPAPVPAARSGAREMTSLFGYADPADAGERALSGAHAAALAMASGGAALPLGIFGDPAEAERIELGFAALGAVEVSATAQGGRPATSLTLSWLKPGVTRADVLALARELGLSDVALR